MFLKNKLLVIDNVIPQARTDRFCPQKAGEKETSHLLPMNYKRLEVS